MAGEQSSDDTAVSPPDTAVDVFQVLEKQSSRHWWLAIIGIPLVMATFMAGLIGLAEIKKSTDTLMLDKPESFSSSYSTKIQAVKGRAAAQYQQYFQQLEDNASIADSIRLGQLYQLGLAGESDYVSLLTNYQQLYYELASRVKGSGEWYYYFKKSLGEETDKASKRQAAMNKLVLEAPVQGGL